METNWKEIAKEYEKELDSFYKEIDQLIIDQYSFNTKRICGKLGFIADRSRGLVKDIKRMER